MDKETQQQQEAAQPPLTPPLYGPFHRVRSPTQTDDVARRQQVSREIWGRPRQYSDIPQVQAYTGTLPAEETAGVEFYTTTPPDAGTAPGQARWTGPRPGVMIKDGFCPNSRAHDEKYTITATARSAICNTYECRGGSVPG